MLKVFGSKYPDFPKLLPYRNWLEVEEQADGSLAYMLRVEADPGNLQTPIDSFSFDVPPLIAGFSAPLAPSPPTDPCTIPLARFSSSSPLLCNRACIDTMHAYFRAKNHLRCTSTPDLITEIYMSVRLLL